MTTGAMVVYRVEKVVAVTLLEATKVTMEQVGRQRMELAERGGAVPKDLVSLYGSLRRLRDYLQRCINAFRDEVEIDLPPEDLPQMVACCRRGAEQADERLTFATAASDRDWLRRKRTILGDWAVELATKPLLELPLTKAVSVSPAMRQLEMRLRQKISGEKMKVEPIGTTPMNPDRSAAAVEGAKAGAKGDADAGERKSEPPAGMIFQAQAEQAPSPAAAATAVEEDPVPPGEARLLDPKRVRDGRLRALVALDQRALARALAADDYRIAAVHLASILEAAVLDHGLTREKELGLVGAPETWNAQEVLLRVLGADCTNQDRACVYHAFMPFNLIRPGRQLKSPGLVTPATFKRLREFAARALREMGFG
jgi:hypothetical protein